MAGSSRPPSSVWRSSRPPAFFLNAVFAFAIAKPGRPEIRPAFTQARSHAAIVFGWGGVIGLMLGLAALYVIRWGH
jgi:hypothetical protein